MSGFLYPAGLALLLALPIILWLHLRRRRPRRLRVPSLSPWLQLLSQTPPRKHRPPPSLLLLLHLLVALFLGLAAAGSLLPNGSDAAGDRVLLMDLTLSMAAEGRWAAARERAEALIASSSGSVGVVALGESPRVLVARDSHGRNALDAIRTLRPEAAWTDLEAGLRLARAVGEPGAELVLIGDGGALIATGELPAGLREERVGAAADNLAITRLAAGESAGLPRLFARVENFSDAEARVDIRLLVDGADFDERSEELTPDRPLEFVWALPAAARQAQLVLDVDDALEADDRATVALRPASLRIQMAGESAALRRALAALPDVSVSRVGLGELKADGSIDASIFVGKAPSRLPPGGVVLVDLDEEAGFALGSDPIAGRILATGDHALVRGLDLRGVVLEGLRGPELPTWAEPVLVAEGRLAAFAGTRPTGRQVVLAFDPDEGALDERVAFPVLVARILDWVSSGRDPREDMAWSGGAAESDLRAAVEPEAETDAKPAGGPGAETESDAGFGSGSESVDGGPSDGTKETGVDDAEADRALDRGGGRPLWPWLALAALLLLPTESALRAGWFSQRPARRVKGGGA